MKIVLVNYGLGNIRSIINAFKYLNVELVLSSSEEELLNSDGIILPGVGAFENGINRLRNLGLDKSLTRCVEKNIPLLGICLGMQLLMDKSEEFGENNGLGFISGNVMKFDFNGNIKKKLPHIRWSVLEYGEKNWSDTILEGLPENSEMYFVHSYFVQPKDPKNILSKTDYEGHLFCSSVQKDLIYGCQFHPEKSGKIGQIILKNFINICENVKRRN